MFPQTSHFLKCVPLSVCGAHRWVVGDERSASLVFLCDALRLDQSDQSVANPVYNVRSKTSKSKDVTASLQHRFNVKLFSMQQKLDVSSAVSGLMDRWMNRFINRSMEILWMDEAEGKRRSEWRTTGCGKYFCFVQTAVSFQMLVSWALFRRTIIR